VVACELSDWGTVKRETHEILEIIDLFAPVPFPTSSHLWQGNNTELDVSTGLNTAQNSRKSSDTCREK
jgi:hypothetical protein